MHLKTITIFKKNVVGATFVSINGYGKPLFANVGHLEAKTFGNFRYRNREEI